MKENKMPIIEIKNLFFAYSQQQQYALNNISLNIEEGEFVVVCGSSGCGKSTLLRQLKPVLTPHGKKKGTIIFDGQVLNELDLREQAQKIGYVQQNPDNQIVTDKVWHELAFGLESLGQDTVSIRRRVAEISSFFGIESWFYQDTAELSGGQKQLLNLASVMIMQPEVLILDEPTSQLDPIAATNFISIIEKINRELGTTIIMSEHCLEEILPLATKVVVLDNGEVFFVGTPQEAAKQLKLKSHSMLLAMPTAVQVWASVKDEHISPLTVKEGQMWLADYSAREQLRALLPEKRYSYSNEIVVEMDEIWFKYEKNAPDVVKSLSLKIRKGEFIALLGGNGTGKTTTVNILAGLQKPYRGKVKIKGRVGVLPQNPQTLFAKKSVKEELTEITEIIKLCRLEKLLDSHPYDLSGGEQQRLAFAKVLLQEPEILLLDEPTKGVDAEFKEVFAEILQYLQQKGVTILMVSHDLDFCAKYAHRCALFFDGSIVAMDTPREFFSGNSFYTTAANRLAREYLPQAITAEDIILACGGQKAARRKDCSNKSSDTVFESNDYEERKQRKEGLTKRTILTTSLLFFLIPLTLLLGEKYFFGRKYLLIAILIMLEMMLPFFFIFEKRKPQAREIVLIAVLCAIGIVGRMIFFMLPEFKPVWAVTIISGTALGGEVGFLVGAIIMLLSNIMFSQGPWTPWQMFAMGIIGFLAGILFYQNRIQINRKTLSVFGMVSCIVIYGGIMNPVAALMWSQELSWEILLLYYISGFPVDCIHAVSTALFLWFGAEPMLEKLERVKIKYNILEED